MTLTLIGDQVGPHSPIDPIKANFLHHTYHGIRTFQRLSVELDWVGRLDEAESMAHALVGWYSFAGQPTPSTELLWQEAEFLSYDHNLPQVPQVVPVFVRDDVTVAKVTDLHTALRENGWSADTTSADVAGPGFDPRGESDEVLYSEWNKAAGQCAVTSLVVQDTVGGDIVRVPLEDGSHYYNVAPNGVVIDLTREQFEEYAPTGPAEVRTREYLLSNASTAARYTQLTANLAS